MTKFKVGEVVNFYSAATMAPEKCRVNFIHPQGWIEIIVRGDLLSVHPKHLCRLKPRAKKPEPRKPREFEVLYRNEDGTSSWIRVREVLK